MSVLQNIDKLISNSWFFPSGIAVVLSTLYIGYAPTSIGLGALGFFILWYRLRLDKNINFHFALVLPFLIYGLMLISYFWSIDQPLSLKGLGRLSNFVIIPAMFILMPRFDVKATNRVLMLFTYSNCAFAVVFLIIAVLRFIKSNDTAVFAYHELVSGLELNAIYVSIF
ncbi:MAG: hypothetical protein KJN68_06455, partial [Bacteroidia bacterium]|nr:hypothetical protein [Bacteroidia bacterium]